jgi:Tfp pilus assembly protein FimV
MDRTPAATVAAPPDPVPAARRAPAAVYRRRRVVAGAVVLAVAWAGVGLGSEVLGRMTGTQGGLAVAGASGEPVAYVVQPGDTWWELASRVAPGEDPRPVVDALVELNDGVALEAGRRILLPG